MLPLTLLPRCVCESGPCERAPQDPGLVWGVRASTGTYIHMCKDIGVHTHAFTHCIILAHVHRCMTRAQQCNDTHTHMHEHSAMLYVHAHNTLLFSPQKSVRQVAHRGAIGPGTGWWQIPGPAPTGVAVRNLGVGQSRPRASAPLRRGPFRDRSRVGPSCICFKCEYRPSSDFSSHFLGRGPRGHVFLH